MGTKAWWSCQPRAVQCAPPVARVTLILNPVSGKGRARRAAPDVRTALETAGHVVTVLTTDRTGAARRHAVQALRDGCEALVTLGGDGTLSEAVDGVLSSGPWPEALTVTPLPLGTGNSFVRHFGPQTGDWRAALAALIRGERRWVDAARVVMADGAVRHMVNVFGTGFMAHAADTGNRRFKWLGGSRYTAGVLWQVARLSVPRTVVSLEGPDAQTIDRPATLVAVCNTQWTGEDMWIAPRAEAADGLFDVLVVGPLTRFELLRLFPKIFKGTHVNDPAVACYRASRIGIEPRSESPLLIDGEVLGRTPATVDVLPRAVQIAL
jgi:diacylglycerol kinase (ATP)